MPLLAIDIIQSSDIDIQIIGEWFQCVWTKFKGCVDKFDRRLPFRH